MSRSKSLPRDASGQTHRKARLTSESVEGLALPLEGVDNIHGGDGLPASVLGVGDGITDDVLKEDLEDSAGLLVDEAADALDSTPAGKTADGRLGDALDVVAKDLPVALGAALSETLSSLSASCSEEGGEGWVRTWRWRRHKGFEEKGGKSGGGRRGVTRTEIAGPVESSSERPQRKQQLPCTPSNTLISLVFRGCWKMRSQRARFRRGRCDGYEEGRWRVSTRCTYQT